MMVAKPQSIVDVRWRSVSATRDELSRWLALLTETERQEASRFRQEGDRYRFIIGRGLVRSMIARRLGIETQAITITRDPNGKPYVPDQDGVSFSVSHSGDIVLAAVANGEEIGVDVERHRENIDIAALGRLVFSPEELSCILAAPPLARHDRFFRQWVFKEALVKALGTGLLKDPRRFQVAAALEGPAIEFIGDDGDDVGDGWHLSAIDMPKGYSGCLCIRRNGAAKSQILAA